jgi:hypothetical protein
MTMLLVIQVARAAYGNQTNPLNWASMSGSSLEEWHGTEPLSVRRVYFPPTCGFPAGPAQACEQAVVERPCSSRRLPCRYRDFSFKEAYEVERAMRLN